MVRNVRAINSVEEGDRVINTSCCRGRLDYSRSWPGDFAAYFAACSGRPSEAVEVQGEIGHRGTEPALKKFTQLDKSDPLLLKL